EPQRVCLVCFEPKPISDTILTECGHIYCREHIVELFEHSMIDRELFPPRCCTQEISLETIRHFLTDDFIERYLEKSVEFTTDNALYCCGRNCSAFIHPSRVNADTGTVICPKCGMETCATCRQEAHIGSLCPEDPNAQALQELARENGWQQCFSCRNMVELSHGCYHMTCRCTAQFCYVCGVEWKHCNCPQWDENRLVAQGQQIVARDAGRGAPGPNAVAEAVRDLRDNHDCEHRNGFERVYRNQGFGTNCEWCDHRTGAYLPWIWQCAVCPLRVCNSCRLNRL
ncbi:hypothetical protein NA57DRAFT_10086, partial [Rhizodiscina lignyota]